MYELVVRVLRVVACDLRLQIMALLSRSRELSPTALAESVDVSVELVCSHLQQLAAAGLIQRRRSGVWCYCVGESPYGQDAFSGQVTTWLRELLSAPVQTAEHCRLKQVCNVPSGDPEAMVRGAVFNAATAFTNVRRLQLLRRVVEGGGGSVSALSQELGMSASAVSRHGGKLVKRGYLVTSRQGHKIVYKLADQFPSSIHARLFEIVSSTWERGTLQT